ncbi:unnamed protein product [Hermetia illucens]|uniref:Uncharacterized protein n=1 Tax=Hermetia illucens TaxID=343691 RepID=A0A7R8UF12_HERIL|nr:unnamed protein product [Hermetia illucens]
MSVKFPVKLSGEYAEFTEEEIIEVSGENLLIEVNGVFVTYDEFVRIRYSDITRNQSRRILTSRESLVEKANQAGENAYLAEQALMVFINGLKPQLSQYVVAQKPQSVEEASPYAQEEEQRLKAYKPTVNRDFTNKNTLPGIHKVSGDRKNRNFGKKKCNSDDCERPADNSKNRREKSQPSSANSVTGDNSEFRINFVEVEESPYACFFNDNIKLKFLVDTGSSLNLIAARHVFEKNVHKTESISFKGLNSVDNRSYGSTKLSLRQNNIEVSVEFQVARNSVMCEFDGILGIPFLLKAKALINFENDELVCDGNVIKLSRKKLSIPPRTKITRYIQTNISNDEEVFVNGFLIPVA